MLVGASPGIEDAAEREERRRADAELADRIEAIGVEAFAEEWGAQALFAGQEARVAAAAHADRLRNTATGLAAALRGLGTGVMEPLWGRLGELAMPVTLVVGERDAKFRAIAERMAPAIAGSRIELVAGSGHAAQLERPEAVAAAIAAAISPPSAVARPEDLVHRAERERDDVEVAVGAGLDVGAVPKLRPKSSDSLSVICHFSVLSATPSSRRGSSVSTSRRSRVRLKRNRWPPSSRGASRP